jgi:hypothetical protein
VRQPTTLARVLHQLVQSAGIPELKDNATLKSYRLRLDVVDVQAAGAERAQLASSLTRRVHFFRRSDGAEKKVLRFGWGLAPD